MRPEDAKRRPGQGRRLNDLLAGEITHKASGGLATVKAPPTIPVAISTAGTVHNVDDHGRVLCRSARVVVRLEATVASINVARRCEHCATIVARQHARGAS